MSVKIKITNIGGFTEARAFTIKKGLNVLEAPNATGKTSFIHALQTIILSKKNLSNMRHFLNYFFASGSVTLIDEKGKEWSRTLRVGEPRKLIVSGAPFYANGDKAALLAFAVPGNEFMEKVQAALPLERVFEELSGSRYYKHARMWLEKQKSKTLDELRFFREDLLHLENMRDELKRLQQELEDFTKQKRQLPPIKEVQRRAKVNEKLIEKRDELTKLQVSVDGAQYTLKTNNEKIKRLQETIQYLQQEIENFEQQHPNLSNEIKTMTEEIAELRREKEHLIIQQGLLRAQLEATRKNIIQGKRFNVGDCFACGRPFSEKELAKREQTLEKELASVSRHIAETDSGINSLDKAKEDLAAEEIRIKRDIREQLTDANEEAAKLENEVKKAQSTLEKARDIIKKLESKIEQLEKTIEKTAVNIIEQHGELKGKIEMTQNRIDKINEEIERLAEVNEKLILSERKENFLTKATTYIAERETAIKDAARIKFNNRINEVYKVLGFTDFQSIEIDDFFHLKVRRMLGSRVIEQDIKSLSATERLTIAIIAMLAGKEEYLPDFPFFVLDELTTSYDPTRFKTIIDYLQGTVPYTIVTALAPFEKEIEIKMLHGPQALSP